MAAIRRTDHARISHVTLIADDDANIRDILRSLLSEAGHHVIAAASGLWRCRLWVGSRLSGAWRAT